MRAKVSVIGGEGVGEEVARIVAERGHADVRLLDPHGGLADLAGSRVVVLEAAPTEVADAVAERAPAAVVVVSGGAEACEAVFEATLLPPPRVIGAPGGADHVAALVDAVVLDRGERLECLVRRHGRYAPARAEVRCRGVVGVG